MNLKYPNIYGIYNLKYPNIYGIYSQTCLKQAAKG